MLSEAKHLSRWAHRCFASLSMTALDLSVAEELSSPFEPCLNFSPLKISSCEVSSSQINAYEVSSLKMCPNKVSFFQVGCSEISSFQVCRSKISALQLCFIQIRFL